MSQHNNPLELYIAEKLKPIDKYARPTKASGASTELGDVYNKHFLIECKQQLTTENPKINRKTWYKLVSELYRIGKTAFLALENKSGDRFIVMDSEDFFDLIYQTHGGDNG